jgi:hypothetical protein
MKNRTLTNPASPYPPASTLPSLLPSVLPSLQRRALLELSLGLGTAALLQACGGGGGGGSDAPAPPPGPAAKAWQGATILSTGKDNSEQPAIAFDGQGNAMAVWRQLDPASMGGKLSIWARHYSASTGWGAAGRIEADDALKGLNPRVAMDANGNAIAVWFWRDANNTAINVMANRYVAGSGAGSGWGTPVPLELPNQQPSLPQIAVNASGNAVVVWEQFGGVISNIRASQFIAGTGAGTGWSPAQLLETTDDSASTPTVVLAASGHAMAVWSQVVDNTPYILASRFSPKTGWGSPGPIASNVISLTPSPQLALDAAGNAIATWFSNSKVWSNRFIADQWGTAAPLDTVNNSYDPQIAMASNGMATAVWGAEVTLPGGGFNTVVLASRTSSATGPWSSPVALNVPGGAVSDAPPQVATDANGNAVAVWQQTESADLWQLWASRYLTSSSAWSKPERLDKTTGDAFNQQIAMDANGNAILVWTQYTTANGNVVYYNLLR